MLAYYTLSTGLWLIALALKSMWWSGSTLIRFLLIWLKLSYLSIGLHRDLVIILSYSVTSINAMALRPSEVCWLMVKVGLRRVSISFLALFWLDDDTQIVGYRAIFLCD